MLSGGKPQWPSGAGRDLSVLVIATSRHTGQEVACVFETRMNHCSHVVDASRGQKVLSHV